MRAWGLPHVDTGLAAGDRHVSGFDGTGAGVRSQSGLDSLLLFVVAVVAVVFLIPHALGLVGIDVRGTAGAPAEPSDHDLTILAARGEAIADDRSSIGAVRLVVAPNHDRAPVNLHDGTAILVGDDTAHLAPAGTDRPAPDGTYSAVAEDSGAAVLETPTDRGILRFDLGTDDVDAASEVGQRLATGESATITLVTPHGEHLTRDLAVPESLPADRTAVAL